jgi:predicted O-linked N-acetylglucosamine transferase (SPINDLY family)
LSFGSFNRMSKLNDQTFDLWGALLRAIPDATLLFKGRYLDREPNQGPIVAALRQRGIAPERLSFRPDSERLAHLAAFADIDIQLDPTPQGGGISTLDALWMGVPVLTLHAKTVNGRAATSIQTTLGLPQLIAKDPAEYVEHARRLAADIPGLARLRASLRARMAASPIANGPLYAKAVDEAYRRLWRDWCRAQAR